MGNEAEVLDDKAFDTAFAEAAVAAEKNDDPPVTKNADEDAATKAAEDAAQVEAAAAVKAQEDAGKTPEQIAAEVKAAEDAAAAQAATDATAAKATADAAALEEANKGKTPEQIAADAKAADDVAAAKVVADAAAAKKSADDKVAADAAALVAKKPPEETPEQKAARETFEASIKPYEPTAEEKTAMAKFKEDFPNEHAAMESRFKSVDKDINQRVYKAVQDVLTMVYKDIAPVVQGWSAESTEKHFAAIRQAHKDYDAVVGLIPEWIKTQPAYLQGALQKAYDEGATSDVIDLVGNFKKATGRAAAPDAAAVAAAKVVADAAAAKAAQDAGDLLPVGTKRVAPAPKGGVDINDYDGAFAEAAAALK